MFYDEIPHIIVFHARALKVNKLRKLNDYDDINHNP